MIRPPRRAQLKCVPSKPRNELDTRNSKLVTRTFAVLELSSLTRNSELKTRNFLPGWPSEPATAISDRRILLAPAWENQQWVFRVQERRKPRPVAEGTTSRCASLRGCRGPNYGNPCGSQGHHRTLHVGSRGRSLGVWT